MRINSCLRPGRGTCTISARTRHSIPPHHLPWKHQARRHFGLDALTTVLIPPAVFTGLLVSLWTYKCIMMVVFQNKIIYMPGVPPFSRSEKVEDYASQCKPVEWNEHAIRSSDGTVVKMLEGNVSTRKTQVQNASRHVVVLYLQGNASSLPPRLPYLSRVLTAAAGGAANQEEDCQFTLFALSYRGYWTSSGRPSQQGIELDVQSALVWILDRYRNTSVKIVVWGQSIGAGAASVALSNLARSPDEPSRLACISGLLLETPFIDLRTMLIALYPQKFLPYRYLAPFLQSTWDSKTALTVVGNMTPKPDLKVLMLQAGDDELVPADNAPYLEKLCQDQGISAKRVLVSGALHTDVMMKSQGRILIAAFIKSFAKS